MSTPELKPCPFCGGSAYSWDQDRLASCKNRSCPCSGDFLIAEWNTRHNPAESALNAAREVIAFALTKEEGDMSDAEQCGGWDDVDWINAHARANRYRAALAQIDKALSPQQSKTT